MVDEENEKTILIKDISSSDDSEDTCHQVGDLDLIDCSGLRFDEGLRSVIFIVDMIEGRIKLELERAKMLHELSSRWSKTFAAVGDGDFDHGTVFRACNKLFHEPIDEANIHNKLRNLVIDPNGPLKELRIWLTDMAESPVPPSALHLYYQANRKQKQIEEDIHCAKINYHYKMYKLGKIRAYLENHYHLNSTVEEDELRRKYALYSKKADNSKQKYLALLSQERDGRESYIANVNEAKKQFAWFDRSRRLVINSALKKYWTIMAILDTERDEHRRVLLEVRSMLARMDVNLEATTLTQKYLKKCRLPVYKGLKESVLDSPAPSLSLKAIREATLRWRKSFLRKKGAKNKRFLRTSGSDDIRRNILPDNEDSGVISYDDNTDGYFHTVFCDGKNEVSTSESETDWSQHQESHKVEESAKHDRELHDNTNIHPETSYLGEEKEQIEAIESSDTVDDLETPSSTDVTNLANGKVVAIEAYQAQTADELSFRKGQTIKQKHPPNMQGMAYGWTRQRSFSRKQYGYYPASIVQLEPKKKAAGEAAEIM